MFSSLLASLVLVHAAIAAAVPLESRSNSVSVTLGGGTFVGEQKDGLQKFLGIPFAQPPVGNLRFRLPQPITSYNGTYDARKYGPSCPQQSISLPLVNGLVGEVTDWMIGTIFGQVFPDAEDCLTVNVVKPASANANSKLPVVVWIFGGGFQLGSTSMYDGGMIVKRAVDQRQPVIFVSMNYRLSGFGFMASKEIRDAGVGNIGLHDQREALRWIKKHISAFGGDPDKVTIWGESAGAISVALQMTAYDGNHEGLFRGGFMQSGAPIPVGPLENGQVYYDDVVRETGCAGSSDTLECLRGVPYNRLKAAINKSPSIFDYQSLRLAWLPRTDGVFLTDDPLKLVQQGKVARVPFVNGNCDDEGTLFSLATLNVTTDAGFKNWVKNVFLRIPDEQVERIAQLYPSTPSAGSPFGTGNRNALTPQFKRFAAFQGDGVFQAPRRWFLQHTAHRQDVWTYVHKRLKGLPVLGAAHATDLLNSFFLDGDMNEHLVRFATTLNPSGRFHWPKYDTKNKHMLSYNDGIFNPLSLTKDDYREEAMQYLIDVTLENPV
ncbi:carotenoid ester lipase [Coprinopsis cinerea AmutBmut pab1-1]|nr:carotenoid ester lipase [Coprinopsis cinerea AmutBmut pab1-1]